MFKNTNFIKMSNDHIITPETLDRKRKVPCSDIDKQIIAKVSRKMETLRTIVPARRQLIINSGIGIVGQQKNMASETAMITPAIIIPAKLEKAHVLGENSAAVPGQSKDVSFESANMNKAGETTETAIPQSIGEAAEFAVPHSIVEAAEFAVPHSIGEAAEFAVPHSIGKTAEAAVNGNQLKDTSSETKEKSFVQGLDEFLASYPDHGRCRRLILLARVAGYMLQRVDEDTEGKNLPNEKKKAEGDEDAA